MKGVLVAGVFALGLLVALAAVFAVPRVVSRIPIVLGSRAAAPGPAAAIDPTPLPSPIVQPTGVAARTLLDLSGSGSEVTPAFTVAGPWDFAWSYDCTSMGRGRNFGIAVENGGGLHPTAPLTGVARLGEQETGTVSNVAAGTFHLDVNVDPPCTWHVTVTGPPGPPPPTPRTPALLDAGGTGKTTTRDFVATGPWDLFWSFDCTSLGRGRNLGISVQSATGSDPRGDGVIELAEQESGLVHYLGAGTFRLVVDLEPPCTWHVTVSG
jgi:hypothetical protein